MQYTTEIHNTRSAFKAKYGKKVYPIYWIILLSLILIIVCLPLINVEVSSQSRGMVRSIYDDNKIITVVGGKLTFVNLVNNQQVKTGDTLLIIDDNIIQADIVMQQQLVQDYSDRLHDLEILFDKHIDESAFYTDYYKQAYIDYKKTYSDKQLRTRQLKREYKRNKKAYDKGAISDVEYQQHKDLYETSILSLESFVQNKLSIWREEEKNYTNQLIAAQASLDRLLTEKQKYYITAPSSGSIQSDIKYHVGSFIYIGQELAIVSPDDSLIVECYISPSDIGYISVGQKVKLQLDAFDYNQWGLADATVYEIDKNIRMLNNQVVFIVRCKIESLNMQLKNGYTSTIRKGMTLTARFTITNRTLWQLLYDKIDAWLNPKIISNVEH